MSESDRLTEENIKLRAQVEELNAELERHATDRVNQRRQVEELRNAVRNQRGDDLCWIQNPENAEVAAEREACAKIAEEPYGDQVQAYGYDEPQAVGRKIAAAIRARAEPK